MKSWNNLIRGRANDPALFSMIHFHLSPTLVLSVGVARCVHQGYKLRTLPVPITVNQQCMKQPHLLHRLLPLWLLRTSLCLCYAVSFWYVLIQWEAAGLRGKERVPPPQKHRADDTFSSEHQQVFRPDSATPLLVQSHYLTAWCRMVFSFRPIITMSVGSFGNSKSHWAANKISLYWNWIIKPKLVHADFMEAVLLYIFLGPAIWSESKLALIDLIDCINVSSLPRESINFPQRERSDWLAQIIPLAH